MDDTIIYEVYAKIDKHNRVLCIDGGITICNVDTDTWIKIDEGTGYGGCQQHYVGMPLYTEDNVPRYKLSGSVVVLRTEEEIEADRAAIVPEKTEFEAMQEQIDDLTLLLADMIGGIDV